MKFNMKKESKNKGFVALYIVVAVVLGLLTLMSVANMTGNSFLSNLFGGTSKTSEDAGASLFTTMPTRFALGNQTNCTDSDGGIEPYIFGIVDPGNYYDFCWNNGTNVTNNSNVLAEFYCWDNKVRRTLIYCPHGCAYGECLFNVSAIGVSLFVDSSPGYELEGIDPSRKSCQGGGWYRYTYRFDYECANDCYLDAFSYCSSLSPDCWPKWPSCNGRFCKSACQYFGGDYKNSQL